MPRNHQLITWSVASAVAVLVASPSLNAPAPPSGEEPITPGGTTNYVDLNLFRADLYHEPLAEFVTDVAVTVPDVPGVTGITVSCTGGFLADLETSDGVFWVRNVAFTDLSSMTSSMDGDWTITISGASPSTTTFAFNADALLDPDFFPDFFATPTDVFPPNGSSDVPPDVVFSWSDPTGLETADALAVRVGNETHEQEDNSLFGSLDITDTVWDPPEDLKPVQFYEFAVLYVNIDDAGLVGSLQVVSGSIEWGNSPFAPPNYPPATPLLIIGSQTSVEFEVASVCPDLNGDGNVSTADLLILLGAWGSCAE
jgi:hypothetical protein